MKFFIVIWIGLLLICCKGLRDDSAKRKKGPLNNLSATSVINGKDSLISKACDYFEESSEGGEIRGYYLKTQLIRIEVDLFAELGKVHKEFRNSDVADSFAFEQRYFFYDMPFDKNERRTIDSVFVTGIFSKGVLEKKVAGNRLSIDDQNKILTNIESDRKRYTTFLDGCGNTMR